MIVVEGPDGSGKTTLAETIARDTGREYRRSPAVRATKQPAKAHVAWWREELFGDEAHRIGGVYDRCYVISEPIYTTVMNRKPLTQPGEFSELFLKLLDSHPLVIFCLPPWAAQKQNLEGATEQLKGLTLGRAVIVLWSYYVWLGVWQQLEKLGRCRVLVYDWENMAEISMGVSQYLNEEANRLGQRV